MEKYELNEEEIKNGINRFLAYVYLSATRSEHPKINLIVGGVGSGKSWLTTFLKRQLKEQGENAIVVNSDKIAEFHPYYEEILRTEIPKELYRITRKFVRPAANEIFNDLQKNKISILNENTLNKGESDIEFVKGFRNNGYKIIINVLATDLFVNRLACYEREVEAIKAGDVPRRITKQGHLKTYDGFFQGIHQLESLGLCDEINVYDTGKLGGNPRVVYKLGDTRYCNFEEAIFSERRRQRKLVIADSKGYLERIASCKRSIQCLEPDSNARALSLEGLDLLEQDFIAEMQKDEAKDLE